MSWKGGGSKKNQKKSKIEMQTKTHALRREKPNPANHNKNKLFLAPKRLETAKPLTKRKGKKRKGGDHYGMALTPVCTHLQGGRTRMSEINPVVFLVAKYKCKNP